MTIVNKILTNCFTCEKEYDLDDLSTHCDECHAKLDDLYDDEVIIEAVTQALNKKYLWQDKDYHTGFKTEKEKEIYLAGVKYGMEIGLFFVCSHFGDEMIEKFEKLAGWK